MRATRITKKLTKVAAYILGGIVVLLVGFHFWFVNHAEGLIEDMVHNQSKGKLHLSIDKFKFDWFNRKIEMRNAVFYSTDTLTASTAHRFEVDNITIQIKKILPVIFEKRFYIDSIKLVNPDISVIKLRVRDSASIADAKSDTSLSIPQEMGRVYNSIQDALKVLEVDRFQIDNGKFSLINKTRPEEKPIIISRLYFHLDNLHVVQGDTTKIDAEQRILFSDDVGLQTTHQDILFPDGRHRLSFSNFRINIRSRLAEFDSCTIIATKGDSANNSFRIFFDKLRMTNIDFDTLYQSEVIKADSVYCINPRFRLDLDLPKQTGPVNPPKIDELIQQLTGNMQLAFVIVQNASFDINTIRDGRPSSFTSDHNNFELQGLRIRENAPQPLTVDRFAMAIRNYETFLKDSTYSIQFDSILLNNNRISLSNFSYKELKKNGNVLNSLTVPQFELQGLSWDNLIIEQQLKAERVTLFRPVINYNTKKKSRSQNIFNVLADIGNIFQLNNLNIRDGKINLFLSNNASLRLEGATISVSAKELVDSRKMISIQRSVNELNFTKGLYKAPGMSAALENVQFNGTENKLKVGGIHLNNKNTMAVDAKNVTINSMILNDKFKQTIIKGISWEQADVRFLSAPGSGSGGSGGLILEDIAVNNTKISASRNSQKISVSLKTISADRFERVHGKPMQLKGFAAKGNDLDLTDDMLRLNIKNIDIADRRSSSLEKIFYNSHTGDDSVLLEIPSITLVPDINAIMQGKIQADAIKVFQPYVKINLVARPSPAIVAEAGTGEVMQKKNGLQNVLLGSLAIQQPIIHFQSSNEKGSTILEWTGKENPNSFEISNLRMDSDPAKGVSIGQLLFSMDHFQYTSAMGKKFDAGNGKVTAQLNQMVLQKNEMNIWDWKGTVTHLAARNFVIDSLGKKGGTFTIASAKLNDLSISSALLLDIRELVTQNTRFNLQEVTASYHTTNNQFNWFNAAYDRKIKYFSVDSFLYRPTLEKDDFIKAQTYQADYLTTKTGKVGIGPFDIQRYIRDTILDLGVITINGGNLTSFRDKRPQRLPGDVRPLPVNLLKKISTNLQIDTLHIRDANVEYEELNEKTNAAGTIVVARLNGNITQLRNFDFKDTDSMDIRIQGYIQDTLLTKLRVKESYTDSLGGFLMTAQMGPGDLTLLNSALLPLTSAELKSGTLDTMTLRVVGREYLAFGEMKLYYHDLKVKITRRGKRTILTSVVTFFANTLVKNENSNRTGIVFFERLRDRSAINYLVKIALSGMPSSVGIKKNKKLIKKYEREIRSRGLPPIEM